MQNQNRQLAAILFTDIVGYTAMMQQDEQKAVAVTRHYITVLSQSVETHHGKVLNDYGDGSLCTFPSITDALYCAIKIQQQLQAEPKVPLRIGLHSGEVFFEGNKVMGDSVNIASRIQSLGQANTILFSKEIADKIKNQIDFKCISLGNFEFRNVDEPMEIFALANEGLKIPKREEMSGKLKEIEKKTTRKKIIVVLAMILLLTAVFFIYQYLSHPIGFTGEKTIAVLPFENTGVDKSEDYISDGITQDIIQNLSKISALKKVIGWISVKRFKYSTSSIKQIADELGVAAILSGTIQKQGNKTHIDAALTEVGTNKQIWGQGFDYSGKDLLSIQSEVARLIVTAMKASVTPDEKKGLTKHYTENVEAYKYYRKGRSFWDARSPASYDSAEANYRRATELDPDYALAYAGLADCYTYNQKGLPQMDAIPIARVFANKALLYDSTLTEALTTLAFIQSHYDYDWAGAKVLLEKIIRDNPNYPVAHLYYGNVLFFTGNIEAGINETRKALSLDPLSAVLNYVLGRNFYYAGKNDSAITQLQKAIILNPNFKSNYSLLGLTFVRKKLYPNAIAAFSKLPTVPYDQGNNGLLYLTYCYAMEGDTLNAKATLNKISKADLLNSSYPLAQAYIALGYTNEAITQLENAYTTHSLGMIQLQIDPAFEPIRNEPRFKALLKKMRFDE